MNKKSFSRRDFLRIVSGLGMGTALGKLLKFFPEVDPVFAKTELPADTPLPPLPPDLVVKPIKGKEASEIISQVMESPEGIALRGALSSFQAVPNEARVSSAIWSAGAQNAIIASIHFADHQGKEAVLQYVAVNGSSETVMIVIPDNLDTTRAKIYTVAGRQVNVIDTSAALPSGASIAASSNCNQTQMINCLQAWGCSGWALTSCIVAFLSCPFTLFGCVAAFACSAYCGGAFSQCWCWLCGC